MSHLFSPKPSQEVFSKIRSHLQSVRIPGAESIRSGIDRLTPSSSYEDDFPSRRWPQFLLASLSGFVGILLLWSLIARSDISVSSEGRLRPSQSPTRTRAQSVSSSKKIFVKEGDLVQKGQAILQLDDSAFKARLSALEIKYARGYIELRETSRITGLEFPNDLKNIDIPTYLDTSVLRSSLDTVESQREKANQLQAQIRQASLKGNSLEENINLQSIIVKKYQMLNVSGAIAEMQLLQQQQRLADLKGELSVNNEDKKRLQSALRETTSLFKGSYSQQLNELRATLAEIRATEDAISNSLLKAPLDGYVFRLAVNVPGVPVSPGDELFQIIPKETLTASVNVPAAQIGFIHPGMNVDVHIDSYPSSTYGVLKGSVTSIGRDSVEPTSPIQLPTYSIPVGVKLQEQTLLSNGKSYSLKPGMTARVTFNLRNVSVFRRLFDATSSIINPPSR